MRNFLKEFQERIRRMDNGETAPRARYDDAPAKPSRLPLYNVVAVFNGVSKVVGFNLPFDDAELIKRNVTRKLARIKSEEEIGKVDFEITIVELKKI